MKSYTTLTDLRTIMKMHADGADATAISKKLDVFPEEIQRIIDIKSNTKKTKKKSEPAPEAVT